MTVSVLVPYADQGCEWRRRAWDHVRTHYSAHHDDWQVVVGTSDAPWSKGAALADAYSRASGDVLVLADADSWTDPDTLRTAATTRTWAVPHSKVFRLSEGATERLYAGETPPHALPRASLARHVYTGPLGGGIVVLTRAAWETVGGVDPRFLGWGGEDVSLGWALATLVGPGLRLAAPLYHLWHPHPAPHRRGSPESEALVARYRAARLRPDRMAALVAEFAGVAA